MAKGQDIVDRGLTQLKKPYIYGILVDKTDPDPDAFDCAEFASWCLYQVTKILYGTDQHSNPVTADAYTGYWLRDAEKLGKIIRVDQAKTIPGAFILRYGVPGLGGHIVISDGKSGTVEAHSHVDGVIRGKVTSDRRFTHGILVPGVEY